MAKLTSADPHHALLLPFQRTILSSILPSTSGSTQSAPSAVDPLAHAASQTDGLVLLARGLGLRTIVSAFLKVYDDPTNLVLVVNATPEEEKGMAEELGMRLKVVGFEMGAKER
jgi:DNA excision repair protein ERCC-4